MNQSRKWDPEIDLELMMSPLPCMMHLCHRLGIEHQGPVIAIPVALFRSL